MTRGQVVIGKGVPANHIFIFLALGFLSLVVNVLHPGPAIGWRCVRMSI